MTKFSILHTKDRKGAKDDYMACTNPSIKKEMQLGRFAVLVLPHPEVDKNHSEVDKKLKVPCRVVVDKNLKDTEVGGDQSLRNAIGIPYKYDETKITTEIYPLRLSLFQHLRYFISYILGRRYLFFRVCKADISDLETNICRIPLDSFKLLGCEEGDKVVCECPGERDPYRLKELTIKCYGVSEKMIENRVKMEEENILARYPSAEKLLKVSPDIPRIFLDAHARKTLYACPLAPVRVSRNLFHLFLKQIREFGIIFLLSLLAVAYILPIEITWQSIILILVISIATAFLLILLNIRAKIK